jgi:anti-sigma B factor antagonist
VAELGGTVTRFEIGDAQVGNVPGIAVRGEIDINAVDALDTALDMRIRTTAGAFVVDLTETTFLDSSGLATLMRARGLLGREDRELVIVCRPGPVRRTFELTGTSELFVVYSSPEEALAALVPTD